MLNVFSKSMRIKNHSLSLLSLAHSNERKYWGPVATVVITICIYFATQVLGGIAVTIYPTLKGQEVAQIEQWLRTSVSAQFFLILAIEILVIAAVLFVLSLRRINMRAIGIKKPKWVDILYALAGFGIYFLVYVAVYMIVQQFFDLDQKQEIGFETAQKGKDLIWVFFSLVVFPPIAEEILCRGFLYTGLREKWPEYKIPVVAVGLVIFSLLLNVLLKGQIPLIVGLNLAVIIAIFTNKKYPKMTAAVITSGVFALAHLQFGNGLPLVWAAAIDTFVLSLVLVYLRDRRGSLTAPIILHMLKNSVAFVLLFVLALR